MSELGDFFSPPKREQPNVIALTELILLVSGTNTLRLLLFSWSNTAGGERRALCVLWRSSRSSKSQQRNKSRQLRVVNLSGEFFSSPQLATFGSGGSLLIELST